MNFRIFSFNVILMVQEIKQSMTVRERIVKETKIKKMLKIKYN